MTYSLSQYQLRHLLIENNRKDLLNIAPRSTRAPFLNGSLSSSVNLSRSSAWLCTNHITSTRLSAETGNVEKTKPFLNPSSIDGEVTRMCGRIKLMQSLDPEEFFYLYEGASARQKHQLNRAVWDQAVQIVRNQDVATDAKTCKQEWRFLLKYLLQLPFVWERTQPVASLCVDFIDKIKQIAVDSIPGTPFPMRLSDFTYKIKESTGPLYRLLDDRIIEDNFNAVSHEGILATEADSKKAANQAIQSLFQGLQDFPRDKESFFLRLQLEAFLANEAILKTGRHLAQPYVDEDILSVEDIRAKEGMLLQQFKNPEMRNVYLTGNAELQYKMDIESAAGYWKAIASGSAPELYASLNNIITSGCKVTSNQVNLKGEKRITGKINEYRDEGAKLGSERILDYCRAQVECPSSKAMREQVEAFLACPKWTIVRIKNNLANGKKPYNIHINAMMTPEDGGQPIIFEVQFVLAELIPLLKISHRFYKVHRPWSIYSLLEEEEEEDW